MKSLNTLLLFVFISSAQLDAQLAYKFSDIFFLDSTNGWILGTQNYLWKTTNAGTTWTSIYDPRIDTWGKLYFINEHKGWLLLDTRLYFSSDGGNNWTFKYELPLLGTASDIIFVNDSIGFIAGYGLYKTMDSGNSWNSILDTLPDISCVSFYDENLGFIGTNHRVSYLFKTTDLGSSWIFSNDVGSYDGAGFLKIQILNNDGIYVSSWYADWIAIGVLQKSTDQGVTWKNIGSLNFGITDFEFENNFIGWMLSSSGTISGTSDGGLNWSTLHNSTSIFNFEFFNSTLSYGITQNYIYFTNDGWVTYSIADSIVTRFENQNEIPTSFKLSQNYPNPFNPTTKIKYEIPKRGWVTLQVFDLLGQEIETLVDREKDAGVHEVDFNSKDLPSEVYIYKLYFDGFVMTKKMILLR